MLAINIGPQRWLWSVEMLSTSFCCDFVAWPRFSVDSFATFPRSASDCLSIVLRSLMVLLPCLTIVLGAQALEFNGFFGVPHCPSQASNVSELKGK